MADDSGKGESYSGAEKGSLALGGSLAAQEAFAKALAPLGGQIGVELAEHMANYALGPVGLVASTTYGYSTDGAVGAVAEGGGFLAGWAATAATAEVLGSVPGLAESPYGIAGIGIASVAAGFAVSIGANNKIKSLIEQSTDPYGDQLARLAAARQLYDQAFGNDPTAYDSNGNPSNYAAFAVYAGRSGVDVPSSFPGMAQPSLSSVARAFQFQQLEDQGRQLQQAISQNLTAQQALSQFGNETSPSAGLTAPQGDGLQTPGSPNPIGTFSDAAKAYGFSDESSAASSASSPTSYGPGSSTAYGAAAAAAADAAAAAQAGRDAATSASSPASYGPGSATAYGAAAGAGIAPTGTVGTQATTAGSEAAATTTNGVAGANAGEAADGGESTHPIILAINGAPLSITRLDQSNQFVDTANDGTKSLTAWAGAGNAVLFYDSTGHGVLTRASQYVFTDLDPAATSDLQALQDVYARGANVLSATTAGANWGNFFLDVTNANGTTTVESLAAAGITSISLTASTASQTFADGSSINGETSYTTTSGTVVNGAATVSFATDGGSYSVVSTTTTNGDGSTTIDNVASYPQGGEAFERIENTLISGATTNRTITTLNSGGNVESIQTDATTTSGSGSTETLTNYAYGTISATNRSGELSSSVSTTGAEKLNSTSTTVSVSGGTTTTTIARDQLGGGWTTQSETDVSTPSTGALSTSVSDVNPDSSVSDKTTTVTSQAAVSGGTQYTTTTTDLVDGIAANSTVSTDQKTVYTSGAIVESVTDTVGTSMVARQTIATTPNAIGQVRVTTANFDGTLVTDLTTTVTDCEFRRNSARDSDLKSATVPI